MPYFSKKSKDKLSTCGQELQDIFNEVINIYDCSILEGHRTKEKQDEYYEKSTSQLKWPNSKHNKIPSGAVDVAPYPIDWNNIEEFKRLMVIVKDVAKKKNIRIRCGGDWKNFKDYPHYELEV